MIDIAIYERGSLQFANLGYRLFNRYWGQGLAGEAVGAAITIGHRDLKLQRLEASIDLHNKRSIKLVKKLGLEREGIKRAYWFQNGGWDDQVIYVARAK
jgi:ribosomal-protein-alanine N-acetyltransferase